MFFSVFTLTATARLADRLSFGVLEDPSCTMGDYLCKTDEECCGDMVCLLGTNSGGSWHYCGTKPEAERQQLSCTKRNYSCETDEECCGSDTCLRALSIGLCG